MDTLTRPKVDHFPCPFSRLASEAMKLFIFRCLTRRRLYGATPYETGSNLPKDKCSGGWEFYEQVELRSRGAEPFRFAVDLDRVRRHVAKYGWCVWDETPKEPLAHVSAERK